MNHSENPDGQIAEQIEIGDDGFLYAKVGNNVKIDLTGSSYQTWKDAKDNIWYIRGNDVFVLGDNGMLQDAGIKADVLGGAAKINAAAAAVAAAEEQGTEADDADTVLAGNKKTETIDGADYTVYTIGKRSFYVYQVESIFGGNEYRVYEKTDGKLALSDVSWRMLNAAATGESCAAGGSFVINVLNDRTESRISRNVKAKNVNVNTTAKNILKSTSRASANGAASTGSSDASSSSGSGGGDSGDPDPPGQSHQASPA